MPGGAGACVDAAVVLGHAEFFGDLYGLVSATVIYRGRYGKTRELSASLPKGVVGRLLQGDGR